MSKNEWTRIVIDHLDFLLYAAVAVAILLAGIMMIGDPARAGIAFTTLSDASDSPWGSILAAMGGWLLFTFFVSYMIHRRGEKESSREIRVMTYLLANFLAELDKARIETYQAHAELNNSMLIAAVKEGLEAQDVDPSKIEHVRKQLGRVFSVEIEKFQSKAFEIMSSSEKRMLERFDPRMVKDLSARGI